VYLQEHFGFHLDGSLSLLDHACGFLDPICLLGKEIGKETTAFFLDRNNHLFIHKTTQLPTNCGINKKTIHHQTRIPCFRKIYTTKSRNTESSNAPFVSVPEVSERTRSRRLLKGWVLHLQLLLVMRIPLRCYSESRSHWNDYLQKRIEEELSRAWHREMCQYDQ
jgi:hypothetical protein